MVELGTDFNSRKVALVNNTRALLDPFFIKDE
ncbi:MAG: hypothetical protein US97_C0013G0002 [Microgenomates group bacterium GW2011_GWF1_38_5]|nr:MAG: hypothetical protein US97_C0013G0002 [Microgenomates group bacterium GW2011_GWF1_38_5]